VHLFDAHEYSGLYGRNEKFMQREQLGNPANTKKEMLNIIRQQ